MPPNEFFTPTEEAWIQMHELYLSWRKAGFGLFSASIMIATYIYQLVNSADQEQ